VRSLRLGESSRLSINNGRRQTSPEGGKGRTGRRRRKMKKTEKRGEAIEKQRERERERNGGTKTIISTVHGALRVPRNEKVVDVRHMSRMCS